MNKYIVQMWADKETDSLAERFLVKSPVELDDESVIDICMQRYNEFNGHGEELFAREYEWEVIDLDETCFEVIDLTKEENE